MVAAPLAVSHRHIARCHKAYNAAIAHPEAAVAMQLLVFQIKQLKSEV